MVQTLTWRMSSSRHSVLPLAGAVLAAIGASACCVVPLVLVLLGISGAWIANFAALDPWRPWFIGSVALCLAWAFWTAYRPGDECVADGSCREPAALRSRRRLLWVGTTGIALLLLFPYYIAWFL